MPRPVHLLVEIPEKTDVSSFLWWLKEKSSLIIYEKYPELSETGNFGAEGIYVDMEWKNAKKMEENNRYQLNEDKAGEVKMRKI